MDNTELGFFYTEQQGSGHPDKGTMEPLTQTRTDEDSLGQLSESVEYSTFPSP